MTVSADNQRVTTTIVKVTPEIAAMWLGGDTRNRPVKPQRVAQYAEAMATGNWLLGAPIIRTSDGVLIDGQHRLRAVIRADVPVEMVVIDGADPAVFMAIDTGAARSFGDSLAIAGEAQAALLASSVRVVWMLSANRGLFSLRPMSSFEGFAILHAEPGIRDSLAVAHRLRVEGIPFPGGLACGLRHVFSRDVGEEESSSFWARVADGVGLDEDDPITRLRRYVLTRNTRTTRPPAPVVAAITVKTWNAWRAGLRPKLIAWKPSENFPAWDEALANAI